jgi:predicted small metal-binding protein
VDILTTDHRQVVIRQEVTRQVVNQVEDSHQEAAVSEDQDSVEVR